MTPFVSCRAVQRWATRRRQQQRHRRPLTTLPHPSNLSSLDRPSPLGPRSLPLATWLCILPPDCHWKCRDNSSCEYNDQPHLFALALSVSHLLSDFNIFSTTHKHAHTHTHNANHIYFLHSHIHYSRTHLLRDTFLRRCLPEALTLLAARARSLGRVSTRVSCTVQAQINHAAVSEHHVLTDIPDRRASAQRATHSTGAGYMGAAIPHREDTQNRRVYYPVAMMQMDEEAYEDFDRGRRCQIPTCQLWPLTFFAALQQDSKVRSGYSLLNEIEEGSSRRFRGPLINSVNEPGSTGFTTAGQEMRGGIAQSLHPMDVPAMTNLAYAPANTSGQMAGMLGGHQGYDSHQQHALAPTYPLTRNTEKVSHHSHAHGSQFLSSSTPELHTAAAYHRQHTPFTNPLNVQSRFMESAVNVNVAQMNRLHPFSKPPRQLQAQATNAQSGFRVGDQARTGLGGSTPLYFSTTATETGDSTSYPRSDRLVSGVARDAPGDSSDKYAEGSTYQGANTSAAQPQPVRLNTRQNHNNVITRMNNGSNYGEDVRERPTVQAQPPLGIDISAVEILTFYPNALQHPIVVMRLVGAGWTRKDMAKVQLRATGNLTHDKLKTSENRIQKQIGVGGRLCFKVPDDKKWKMTEHFEPRAEFDDLTANGWKFRHGHNTSYVDLSWEDVPLASLYYGVTEWPEGADKMLLTHCLEYASAHSRPKNQPEWTTADFGKIVKLLKKQGLQVPAQKDSTHDREAGDRMRDTLRKLPA